MTDLNAIALEAAQKAVADAARRDKERAEIELVLESDVALAVWASRRTRMKNPPVVRASVYENKVDASQDIWWNIFDKDPRRPVIMRGARELMIARHGRSLSHCANGLAEAIAARWLRMRRYSCFDNEAHNAARVTIRKWARRKFSLSYHFDDAQIFRFCGASRGDYPSCWVDGHFRWVSQEEFRSLRAAHKAPVPRVVTKPKPRKLKQPEKAFEAAIIARAMYELGIIQPGEML